ncbi:MAG: hypothetical protein ACWA44_05275 [Thiotrichales bacterium]
MNVLLMKKVTLSALTIFAMSFIGTAIADCKPGGCGEGQHCSYDATTGEKSCIPNASRDKLRLDDGKEIKMEGERMKPKENWIR